MLWFNNFLSIQLNDQAWLSVLDGEVMGKLGSFRKNAFIEDQRSIGFDDILFGPII